MPAVRVGKSGRPRVAARQGMAKQHTLHSVQYRYGAYTRGRRARVRSLPISFERTSTTRSLTLGTVPSFGSNKKRAAGGLDAAQTLPPGESWLPSNPIAGLDKGARITQGGGQPRVGGGGAPVPVRYSACAVHTTHSSFCTIQVRCIHKGAACPRQVTTH